MLSMQVVFREARGEPAADTQPPDGESVLEAYHSIKTDMRNAGADWVDQELVEAVSNAGGVIITSPPPGVSSAFCEVLLRQLK
jgi:putative intracellular protease/amidase